MRGEHWFFRLTKRSRPGSSPHARGAQTAHLPACNQGGIIPACAGSTPIRSISRLSTWDHPRMRGEHRFCKRRAGACGGSSPHARGAPAPTDAPTNKRGIIPACAGSTIPSRSYRAPVRDHPRMRGEHGGVEQSAPLFLGSSPHARGAPRSSFGT